MCFNRESDGREKWRFGLDDKNIYTQLCTGTATKKLKKICFIFSKHVCVYESTNSALNQHSVGILNVNFFHFDRQR